MIKIKKGLDLPIEGEPVQQIDQANKARSVAVIGFDYIGMKPTMSVKVGDKVKKGQLLFSDKRNEGVQYTAPAAGTVSAINRGAKRILQSVVIDIEGDDEETFKFFSSDELTGLSKDVVINNLVESGLWTALRTRPYSAVPAIDSEASAIFVAAMDTSPLAGDPSVIIAENADSFADGLDVLARLTSGKVYVGKAPGSKIPTGKDSSVTSEEFSGPHPAGLVGTHIHFLSPVSATKTVWTVGYQDVIAIGKLFTTGKIYTDRVVALSGPAVEKPRLVRTQLGACTDELVAGEVKLGDNRVISGSVLGGRTAEGATAFLGRYQNQVTVIKEGRDRELFGWLTPGLNKHSMLNIYLSKLLPSKNLDFTTNTNGSERAMVPVGSYEKIMPLDILPTQLLRSLLVGDTDTAQQLGALELDEEDLALCTYVCPGKYEYGPILRDNLTQIEKEG